jgi:structural maintenance of chromosome 1
VYQQLLQAGIDKHESEQETKMKEMLAILPRCVSPRFSRYSGLMLVDLVGVKGRAVDLCKPNTRRQCLSSSVGISMRRLLLIVSRSASADIPIVLS